MDVIDEENSLTMRNLEESNDDGEGRKSGDDLEDGKEMKPVENTQIQENEQNGIKSERPAPLEILKQVRINTDFGTPRSAIKGFFNLPSQTDLKFSKDSLNKAEEQLRTAFVEFYHKLRLLKNYW